jgi:hypothetical protein
MLILKAFEYAMAKAIIVTHPEKMMCNACITINKKRQARNLMCAMRSTNN